MARDTDKWAAQARSVFDCSDLTFRSLAELEEYANGLVMASQVDLQCVAALSPRSPLSQAYALHKSVASRQQISRYLKTGALVDFAQTEGVHRVVSKLQLIHRILTTKLQLLEARITAASLKRYRGCRRQLQDGVVSFLDETTGELSQFVRDGNLWTVTTFNKRGGICGRTRVMAIMDPADFEKGTVGG